MIKNYIKILPLDATSYHSYNFLYFDKFDTLKIKILIKKENIVIKKNKILWKFYF